VSHKNFEIQSICVEPVRCISLADQYTRYICLQCFDAVGWAEGKASGL